MKTNHLFPMTFFALALLLAVSCAKDKTTDPGPIVPPLPPENITTYGNESLVAFTPDAQEIGDSYTAPRDRKVGIFYFIWQGAHGYDNPEYYGGDIPAPKASDINSPYDVHEMEKGYTNPQDIPFGPVTTHHFWGKPYLDYYVSNDAWVHRRHAQMLCQAGIDVIFIDLTNGYAYAPVLKVLCDTYKLMAREGNPTPKISFVLNTQPGPVMQELLSFYTNSDYRNLWFLWDGKPLVLTPFGNYGAMNSLVTIRYSWFDSQFGYGGNWWGDGANRWTWGDFSPQPARSEQMSVMAASHPMWNIGRSYTGNSPEGRGGAQPANPSAETSAKGIYFKQQFERAIASDPKFIFVTAWNEWVAQRQIHGQGGTPPKFMGKPIKSGDTFFVDGYNHEFSRDLEPVADGLRDSYYYYLADYVRKYKGTTKVDPVKTTHKIALDGKFDDWIPLETRYQDYRFDTTPRDHWGFGYKNRSLTNTTGRNDIYHSKVAFDGKTLYFYVKTVAPITPHTDKLWMRLFIDIRDRSKPSWEGFQYVVNQKVLSESATTLQRSKGGWDWEESTRLQYAVSGSEMEIAIPISELGISNPRNFSLDFKWIDNSVSDGDICQCMTDGDSAPGDRFRYRYIFTY